MTNRFCTRSMANLPPLNFQAPIFIFIRSKLTFRQIKAILSVYGDRKDIGPLASYGRTREDGVHQTICLISWSLYERLMYEGFGTAGKNIIITPFYFRPDDYPRQGETKDLFVKGAPDDDTIHRALKKMDRMGMFGGPTLNGQNLYGHGIDFVSYSDPYRGKLTGNATISFNYSPIDEIRLAKVFFSGYKRMRCYWKRSK